MKLLYYKRMIGKEITVSEWSDSSNVLKYAGRLVAENCTALQNWIILDHSENGQMLFIDSQHQSSLSDEKLYHETIAHSLLHGLLEPETVLILGGAEGCMVREVLKYSSVKEVVQVDWDKSLVEHFKSAAGFVWNAGAYSDPRVSLVFDDAQKWIQGCDRKFDAILIDLLDPSSESITFLRVILHQARRCLAQGGGLIVNSGIVKKGAFSHGIRIAEYMKELFPEPTYHRVAIHREIPSYCGHWSFLLAVPRTFSHTFMCREPLEGLYEFSREKFVNWTQWPSGYPDEFRNFWRDEKLAGLSVAELSTRVFEHHGC
jgi:spermidine synthase